MNEFFIVKLSSILDIDELNNNIKENIDIIEDIHNCKIKSIESKYIEDDFAKGLISIILYK
jgi:hypothetical protein